MSVNLDNEETQGACDNQTRPIATALRLDQDEETQGAGDNQTRPIAAGPRLDQEEDLKRRQRNLRFSITTTITRIKSEIASSASRRGIRALLSEATRLLALLTELNDCIIDLPSLTTEHRSEQLDCHLSYVERVGRAAETVEEHLEGRAGEADSISSKRSAGRMERQQQMMEAQQAANEATRAAEEARRRLVGLQLEDAESLAEEEQCAEDDGRDRDQTTYARGDPVGRVQAWREQQRRLNTIDEDDAPDAWIETYHGGREAMIRRNNPRDRSSITAFLPKFSGQSLEWFTWIDQFRSLIHLANKEPGEKLAHLKQSLIGEAQFLVSGIGGGESAYKEALLRLKQRYGKRGVMRSALKTALAELKLPHGDPIGFQTYCDRVRTYLFGLNRVSETGGADIIDSICNRLKLEDRLAWNQERKQTRDTSLNSFGVWLCERAAAYQTDESIAASQRNSTMSKVNNYHGRLGPGQKEKQARSHQTLSTVGTNKKSPEETKKRPLYCFKCEADHRLRDCPVFKALPVEERRAFITTHLLCSSCFGIRHSASNCRFKIECGVGDCKQLHHHLLHGNATVVTANTALTQTVPQRIALGVITIDALSTEGDWVPVNVMLDEGSDSTLIREGLVRRLGALGDKQTLDIEGVGGFKTQFSSQRVQIQLRSSTGEQFTVVGSTLPIVTKPLPVTNWAKLASCWSHLSDIPLKSSGGQVDILIGLDHALLMAVEESRSGGAHEPIGSKTKLGWIIRGVIGADLPTVSSKVNLVFGSDVLGPELVQEMRRFCDTDSFGTEHQTDGMSAENRRAVTILEEGTKRLAVGYEVPILWKEGEPELPDNRPLAESRLRSLVSRFRRDSDHEKKYRKAMDKNFVEGYAVRLSPEEFNDTAPAYYLPHFGVKKNRWSDDVRIVYDAAARFKGRSLNDAISSGPILQNPLPCVIIRFREGEIGWAADFKAMFSRIRLRPEDRRFHRFLWPETNGAITVCEMTRVTFGVNCSPFVAIHTTWKTAEDAGPEMAEDAKAIRRNLYMDDYLGSADTVEEAIKIASDVKITLAKGDFNLVGWISNSLEFLTNLQPTGNVPHPTSDTHPLGPDTELVLGVTWKPSADVLGFRVEGLSEITYTRVGLVSKVASLYDPQGTAAPMIVKAKVRLRELGLKGIGWNDAVNQEDRTWWKGWFEILDQLKDLEFPRCLFPSKDQIHRVELHTFCDASEEAYAAVCYVRTIYQDGSIVVRQVKAASKLAPIKTISVPKLELNAAVLGARQARYVQQALDRQVDLRRFWTDSSTVRNWIRAIAATYQTFVSHRVGEIQSLTEPDEWRFIPGKMNPADIATRSELEDEAIPVMWLTGPTFFTQPEERWPADLPWMAVTDEMRRAKVHHTTAEALDWASINLEQENIPSLVGLQEKYKDLVRRCQEEAFPEEIKRLRRGELLRKTSCLLPLTPIYREELIRLGGRIDRAKLPYDRRHPPINIHR